MKWDIGEVCVFVLSTAGIGTCDYDADFDRTFEVEMDLAFPSSVFVAVECERYVVSDTSDLAYFGRIDLP